MEEFSVRVIARLRTKVSEARELGQYTLLYKIGEGGMGEVYRATHAMLRRPTAIKILHADRANASTVTRFRREVELTSQLTHPNTIAIYDYGRTPEGVFYYAMEYLPGITVDRLVKEDGAQPEARVVHILRQTAGSLAEAHAVGLIHRDIKPANIMVCERGGQFDVVKVLDFGLVRKMDSQSTALTQINTLTGTPLYLSPEAIQTPNEVDARTDLYALGAVAYFLVTGTHVFSGKNVIEICSQHLHDAPEPPSRRLGREVAPELEQIILHCLAKRREDRPESAIALLDALVAIRRITRWGRSEARAWWKGRDMGEGVSGGEAEMVGSVADQESEVAPTLVVDLQGRGR